MSAFNHYFSSFSSFYIARYLRLYVEAACDLHYRSSRILVSIYLQSLAHIEYLVPFLPVGTGRFLDHLKQLWYRQQGIINDSQRLGQVMQNLALSPATAVDDTMYLIKMLL